MVPCLLIAILIILLFGTGALVAVVKIGLGFVVAILLATIVCAVIFGVTFRSR